jgi:nitrate/TMAO reductase-like tetraheme cytochrome c subunit
MDEQVNGQTNPAAPAVPERERNRPGFVLLTSHWLSRLGFVLVITATCTWVFFLPAELRGYVENPYKGAVLYLILPVIGFVGVVLTIAGMIVGRRRIQERLTAGATNRKTALHRLVVFLVITIAANLLIGSQLSYRAVTYMDTPQFCGAMCHMMKPEYVGHQDSTHASVECAECHIAPTAGGWIEAKMNGTRQLWEMITNTYPRPIPSALESRRLVPSKETCENCHWAEKLTGTRLVVSPSYGTDEKNSSSYSVLMMLVGGSQMKGIHQAHFAAGWEIRYSASDSKRQTILWVEQRNTRTRETKTYLASGIKPEQLTQLPKFSMQCVDCHNRPTHDFLPADRALNRALALGELDATLAFIKKQGLAVLQGNYSSSADAARKIPAAIETFYEQSYPQVYAQRKADVRRAGNAILAIYNRNVFPDMKVTWGTYANNLGHTDSLGCFRCHDGSHTTADGKNTIGQDCTSCHQLLAVGESSPEILKTLGLWDRIEALKGK